MTKAERRELRNTTVEVSLAEVDERAEFCFSGGGEFVPDAMHANVIGIYGDVEPSSNFLGRGPGKRASKQCKFFRLEDVGTQGFSAVNQILADNGIDWSWDVGLRQLSQVLNLGSANPSLLFPKKVYRGIDQNSSCVAINAALGINLISLVGLDQIEKRLLPKIIFRHATITETPSHRTRLVVNPRSDAVNCVSLRLEIPGPKSAEQARMQSIPVAHEQNGERTIDDFIAIVAGTPKLKQSSVGELPKQLEQFRTGDSLKTLEQFRIGESLKPRVVHQKPLIPTASCVR
jgi:hypothetical protein